MSRDTGRESFLSVARDAELEGRWEMAMAIRAQMAEAYPNHPPVTIGGENPTQRHDWSGRFLSCDGALTTDFTDEDIATVLAYGSTDATDWDGRAAGIIRLKDGRYVAWESDWGPTGSGFCCDAYGGTADIAFANTPGEALKYLSEQSRELLVWA